MGSVYFTENSGYRSLKNRSCVIVFGSCSVTLTVGEPLGDVSSSANYDFRTSVTGISSEIDASKKLRCAAWCNTKIVQQIAVAAQLADIICVSATSLLLMPNLITNEEDQQIIHVAIH